MLNEIYLQKAAQYQAGGYVGVDEEGNQYKGITAFIVLELKQSTPFIVQAIPDVTFNGQWLCDKIASNIENLGNVGFCVHGLIADNRSSTLRKKCPYSELFWFAYSRIWTEYGEILRISPYSNRMRKNVDQNNSEYGHFLRSANVNAFTLLKGLFDPDSIYFLSIQLTMTSERTWFLIPIILLRTSEVIY